MNRRIAAIQHGDYADAKRRIGRGDPEPYFGMAYTLRVLDDLFGESPYLVISLNAARSSEQNGSGQWIGMPKPELPGPIPETVLMLRWAQQIRREIERFKPTHVLLRTGGILGWQVLRYCIAYRLSTLAVFAGRFGYGDLKERYVTRRLVRALNHPCVTLAGNHKRPATDTMIELGVARHKAVAWDWPGAPHPDDWPTKSLASDRREIVYVGSMLGAKGIGDLVEAVTLLHEQGFPVHLTAAGDGPDLQAFKARAALLGPGVATFPGQVANDQAFQLMLQSTVVCVPSRHEFSEGMPLTLTEALASRTPVVASDHPIFTRSFVDGEGIRFFPQKNAGVLAATIRAILEHGDQYADLSKSTMQAYRRVQCTTFFGDLIDQWKATF